MPLVRRRESGRDQFGHHWENDGDAIDLPHDQCSQLLAEPALPMYSLIDHGATIEVEGDAADADKDAPKGRQSDESPNVADKTAGGEAGRSTVVGRSDDKK